MTKVVVLVLQETNTLSLAAAVDPLRAANRQAGKPVFNWQFATPENRDVRLTAGLSIPAAPINRIPACDILILIAAFNLETQSTPALSASLRRLARPDALVLAIDGGPWVLARSGLLNGHPATTHWEDIENFARTFPEIETVKARYVASGQVWTSGGAAPALDMMLHLIETRLGASLAQRVAASFIHTTHPDRNDPQQRHLLSPNVSAKLKRAHRVMEENLETPLAIPQIAERLGQSPRRLQEHFQQSLGTTIKTHYLSLRLAEAHRLLTQSDLSLHQISLATGFGAQSSFSRAYRARYGQSPSATRQNTPVHLAR